jgi:hypothetical protein
LEIFLHPVRQLADGIFFVGQALGLLFSFIGVALLYGITLLSFYCSGDGSEQLVKIQTEAEENTLSA